jgi:hypothetical protein
VLALTVEVMLPSVFDAVVFEANQFHDTKVSVLKFIFPSEPRVNPSLSNDSILLVLVASASVPLLVKYLLEPLTESCKL